MFVFFCFLGGFRNSRFLACFLQNLLFGFLFVTITEIRLFIGSSRSLGLLGILDDNQRAPKNFPQKIRSGSIRIGGY